MTRSEQLAVRMSMLLAMPNCPYPSAGDPIGLLSVMLLRVLPARPQLATRFAGKINELYAAPVPNEEAY